MKSWLILFVLILLTHSCAITQGTFKFFGPNTFGEVFDSIGESLKSFKTDVDPQAVGGEAFIVNGRTHSYFGVWPALLRSVLNAMAPTMYGKWTRVSCLLADLITLFCAFQSLILIGVHWLKLKTPFESRFLFFSFAVFAWSWPLMLIMASPSIYHEAIAWGIAGSFLAIYGTLKCSLESLEPRHLLILSTGISISLLSRATFAFPWFVALGILGSFLVVKKESKKFLSQRFLLSFLPLVLAILLTFWVNYDRFGNIFTFLDSKYQLYMSEHKRLIISKFGLFSIERIFTGGWNFLFGIEGKFFVPRFPYITLNGPSVWNYHAFQGFEPVLPLFLAAPIWFFTLMVALGNGIFATPTWYRGLAGCLFIQVLMTCSVWGITARYVGELLPFFFFVSLSALPVLAGNLHLQKFFKATSLVTVALSMFLSMNATLVWLYRFDDQVPHNVRQIILMGFRDIDDIIHFRTQETPLDSFRQSIDVRLTIHKKK